jgi:GH35 family endo-1,4-beta-xylanase
MPIRRAVKMHCCLNGLIHSALLLLSIGSISFFTVYGAGVKDAAAKVNMYFGSCSGGNPSSYSFVERIKTDYNMLVCENAMKWDATERTQGSFSYSGGDQVVTFAQANNMLVRGHTLVWHAQTPTWVGNLNREQMLAAMKNHINNVMGHWKGKILEWDVVNEAVSAGANSMWQKTIGTGFIDSAFVYAHAADPGAYLYYNDYGSEGIGGKSDQIYTMVKDMKAKGIPIHGVGLQCHVGSSINKSQVSQNIKRLGDLGLRVSCTEVDIRPTNAQAWSNLVGACVENYNATSFMCWGFDDAHSWLGNPCNCQIWDAQGQPKADVLAAVEGAFNNGDPAVAEKRKVFMALSPTAILEGKGKPTALNFKGVPRFRFNNNTLSYHLPSAQNVQVQIIDMQGKTAVDLNLGMQNSGSHSVRLALKRLPAGLYFAKIKLGDQSMHIPFTLFN